VGRGAGFGRAERERAAFALVCDGLAFAPAFARAAFAPVDRTAFARVDGAALALEALPFAVGVAAAAAPPRDAPSRLSLRCPGRDLGRLPSTPGSSLLSTATREK
jgi:hypothetical protein